MPSPAGRTYTATLSLHDALPILPDMEPILGYSSAEYQKIERGVEPLPDPARTRILQALDEAGRKRVQDLLKLRSRREAERSAWQSDRKSTRLNSSHLGISYAVSCRPHLHRHPFPTRRSSDLAGHGADPWIFERGVPKD